MEIIPITKIPPEKIIDAIEKAKAAFDSLNALLLDLGTEEMVKRVTSARAKQFSLDQDDLKVILLDKLRSELHTISNPESFEAWCDRVVERYCINAWKHSKVVKRYEEFVEHSNTSGKRNSIPMAKSSTPTPEDLLIEKEEKPIWEARMADIRDRVYRIITEDQIIARGWGNEQPLDEIAREIHKSVATVYRKLGNMQKAVIEEIGILETDDNKSAIREGLRELFANSLQRLP